MTVICGGGTSQAKIGVNATVAMTSAGIAAYLERFLSKDVAAFMGVFLAGINFIADSVCANDPPAMPTLSLTDFEALGNPIQIDAFNAARSKLTDWFLAHYWCDMCECQNGTVPNCAALVVPAGAVSTNTGAPSGPASGPCFTGNGTYANAQVVDGGISPDWTQVLWNDGTNQTAPNSSTRNLPVPGQGTVTVTAISNKDGVNTPGTTLAAVYAFNSSNAQVGSAFQESPTGTSFASLTVPSTTAYVEFTAQGVQGSQPNPGNPVDGSITVETSLNVCGTGGIGTVASPCCPPDPTTSQQLSIILQLATEILANQTTAPIGYTRSTVHQNITGTGTLTVSGLYGMLAELTSGVPTTPQLPGVPPYQFSVGWMSVLTGDGMIDEIRFTRQAQVWAPALMPLATTFGYQLNEGFTATFTELVPSASARGALGSSAILGV